MAAFLLIGVFAGAAVGAIQDLSHPEHFIAAKYQPVLDTGKLLDYSLVELTNINI